MKSNTIINMEDDDDNKDEKVLEIDQNVLEPPKFSFVLSFTDLTYTVELPRKLAFFPVLGRTSVAAPEKKEKKTILNGVTGEAREGEILALLGASGSGKSTLLDALAGRISRESLKGTVSLNGEALDSRLSRAITAYVMQDDMLFPTLTVHETLSFAAEFRLPRSLGAAKKKERVSKLIDQLGLRQVADTMIGDESLRGVSGGERRRVSIGVDIIHDPVLLFLDEPTSGLDSTSAFTVVKVLRSIAQSGSLVAVSVHQPSYRILELLDRLILLSRGDIVFRGTPKTLPAFFSDFGRPIPVLADPVEFALDSISELESSEGGIDSLVEFNQQQNPSGSSDSIVPLREALRSSVSRGKLVSSNSRDSGVSGYANPLWIETVVQLKRLTITTRRNIAMITTQLITISLTGMILASLYWKVDVSPKGVRDRLGFLAFSVTMPFFCSVQSLPMFLQDRFIFIRETAYNAYRRSSYAVARCLVDLPLLVAVSLAFSVSTFFAVGLAGGFAGFGFFFLVTLCSFWTGNAFVVLVSGLVRSVIVGFTVVLSFGAYFLLFSGFFISKDRIPNYWIWFNYASLIKYPYQAVMQNEFGARGAECFVNGAEAFDGTVLAKASSPERAGLLRELGSACLTTGRDVLRDQSVEDLGKWGCLAVIISWGFFFWILFYFSLLLWNKNKRK